MTKVVHDSETSAHGQQVISACAFIHQEFDGVQKVFLPKRADTKKFLPGLYEFAGGHIDYGEDIVEGLKREVKEEFNMTITVGDPFAAFTYQNLVKGSQTIEVIYFARFIEPLEHITLNPEDHSKYEWFTKEEVVKRQAEFTAVDNITYEHEADPEYLTILKGFDLLEGQPLNFG